MSSKISLDSFNDYNTQLQSSALKATRNAALLPADIGFYRSIDSALASDVDNISSRVLNLANKILNVSMSVDPSAKGKGKAGLRDQDDVADSFHTLVVDVMDQLFERTDTCLDQYHGRNKAPAIAVNPPTAVASTSKKKANGSKAQLDSGIHHASHLPKPQLSFLRKVDNSDTPWYPSLSHKYNAKVPLGYVYTDPSEDVNMDGTSNQLVNHPYLYEIKHLSYPSHIYSPATPTPPASLENTPYTWVSTVEELHAMLERLRNAREIAVDLEHHSYRSYSGFLCLMQLSTREADWVVDVLVLRDEMEALNEVFTNPNVVKVFHGAESDIVWLQQDFNLYIVNLFDTFHASKLLEFPRHGLANLLEMYCDYIPDKRYQLADWRIRPLPTEMLEYARSDTHFLLFIYDNLRNALLDRAVSRAQSRSRSSSPPSTVPAFSSSRNPAYVLIDQVLVRSAETSLRVYQRQPYDSLSGTGSSGWDTLARKWNKTYLVADAPDHGISGMQKAVYRAIHWWRERTAREEDESTRYVLPNHSLFQLAEQPPADMAALLRFFRSAMPPIVKKRANELLDVIRDAVKMSLGETNVQGTVASTEVQVGEQSNRPASETYPVSRSFTNVDDKLWRMDGVNEMIKPASSLLGSVLAASSSQRQINPTYTSTRSALFGGARFPLPTSGSKHKPSNTTQFRELTARINNALVILPAVPKVTITSESAQIVPDHTSDVGSTTAIGTAIPLEEAAGMQVEIPFVPSAHRNVAALKVEERDTIVVVGQPKQKKRKRAKEVKPEKIEGKQSKEYKVDADKERAQEIDTFDFESVPNILDDNPDVEDGNKRKRQKKKGGKAVSFYGDFPAPPKAHSEFKKGNQSHTFK